MRRFLLFAGLSVGLLPLRADSPEAAAAVRLIPAAPPGYELRALDQTKRVVFQVGGSQVEVSVPLFLYCPSAGAPPVARLLREAQASLLQLAAKPEWTADELRQVIASVDQAARLLELPALPGKPVSVGAN